MEPAVIEVRNLIEGTVRRGLDAPLSPEWAPALGSPAMTERAESLGLIRRSGEPWDEHVFDTSWSYVSVVAMGVLDHLNSTGSVMGHSILGHAVMARATAEGAGVVWWALEPDIGPLARVQRATAMRMAGLQMRLRLTGALHEAPDELVRSTERHQEILDEAHDLGIPVHRVENEDGTKRVTGLKVGEPGYSERAAWVLDDAGFVVEVETDSGVEQRGYGRLMYDYLSGLAHLNPSVLMQFFDTTAPPTADELGSVQMRSTLQELYHSAGVALLSVVPMVDRLVAFAGWDEDAWGVWRLHVYKRIRDWWSR